MTSRHGRSARGALMLGLSLCLLASACGGGGDEETAADTPVETTAAPTTEAPTTEAPTTEAPTTTAEPTTTEPPPPLRPELSTDTLNAGPIQVTPVVCDVDVDLQGTGGAEGLATTGNRVIYGSRAGVYAFQVGEGDGCTLTADTGLADGGLLIEDDSYDSISANDSGRVVASGIFGSVVFDTNEGFSYECDMSGRNEIEPGGEFAFAHWPGQEVIEFWDLGESTCSQSDDLDVGTQFVNLAEFAGDTLFVSGQFGETNQVRGYDSDLNVIYEVGSDEFGELDSFSPLGGLTVCGNYLCSVEFFGNLKILDENATVIADMDLEDSLGVWGLNGLASTEDGESVYLLANTRAEDADGETIVFDEIIRLDFSFG